jgi:hypothetical protein
MELFNIKIRGHKKIMARDQETAVGLLQEQLDTIHYSFNLKPSYANKKWDLDLSKGIEMEDTFKEFLNGAKVEVKSERHIWEHSGNHYVEYECDGKPSGIQSTEADYWALMLVREIDGKDVPVMTYIIPIETMLQLARDNWDKRRVIGGDDKKTKGVLVPIKEIALACLNNV